MKNFPKILAALLVIALFVGICSSVSFAAADLREVRLTVDQLKVGYYNNTNLTGDVILHCANSDITKETKNLVDNKSNPFYWSKPYMFSELKEMNGQPNPSAGKVPVILIDVANGGDGVSICGYNMQLRDYLDCVPYSFEIQATLSADSNEWVSIHKDGNTVWDGADYHCEFDEATVYKVRVLFYEIGDADIAKDTAYGTLPAGYTRFSLSEIDLLTKRNAATAPTEEPTQAPTEVATSPGFTTPTAAPTEAPTQAPTATPTQAPTAAPTQVPTVAPTAASTETPTAAPTQAPTETPTQAPTAAPTQAPTAAPTQEATAAPETEPSTPTVPDETIHVEMTRPTDDSEPTDAPTEPAIITTVPATAPATQPEATNPNTDNGGAGKNNAAIFIIAGIVLTAAIAGTCVFFIIKKKRAQA